VLPLVAVQAAAVLPLVAVPVCLEVVVLKEAPAAVGVAPEAVTLSLPEQNLIQILSLSATAEVPGVQEVVQAAVLPLVVVQADPGAARVNVASEQLSPCLDSVNAGWGQRLSFFSFLE
jgi:hypothetical protein